MYIITKFKHFNDHITQHHHHCMPYTCILNYKLLIYHLHDNNNNNNNKIFFKHSQLINQYLIPTYNKFNLNFKTNYS